MSNQAQIPVGEFLCYVSDRTMKIWVRDGIPVKLLVPLMIDVDGKQIAHTEWMSIDPESFTNNGKPRMEYTVENLTKLGATQAAEDLADALDNGRTEVTFAWRDPDDWTPCEVKNNGQYTNLYFGKGATIDTKKSKRAGDAFRRIASKGKTTPAVNPFAPRGVPVPPPPPRKQPEPNGGDDPPF